MTDSVPVSRAQSGPEPSRAQRETTPEEPRFTAPLRQLIHNINTFGGARWSWRCGIAYSTLDPGYVDGACRYDHTADSREQVVADATEHLSRWHDVTLNVSTRDDSPARAQSADTPIDLAAELMDAARRIEVEAEMAPRQGQMYVRLDAIANRLRALSGIEAERVAALAASREAFGAPSGRAMSSCGRAAGPQPACPGDAVELVAAPSEEEFKINTLQCDSCGEPMEHEHEVGARAGDVAVCSACADDAETGL